MMNKCDALIKPLYGSSLCFFIETFSWLIKVIYFIASL